MSETILKKLIRVRDAEEDLKNLQDLIESALQKIEFLDDFILELLGYDESFCGEPDCFYEYLSTDFNENEWVRIDKIQREIEKCRIQRNLKNNKII